MRGVFLVLGLALLLALSALRLADPWPVQALREAGFDGMQRLAPRGVTPDLPVQVVQIDAGTLADLGPWPWPRDLLARLVERLGALGASVVVLDMPLAEPDRLSPARMAEAFRDAGLLSPLASAPQLAALDSDLALVRGLGTVPVVLGLELGDTPGAPPPRVSVTEAGDTPMAAIRPLTGAVAPLPVTLTAAAGLGVMTVAPDATAGVVRRVQVLWRTPDGALMPSLAIEALRLGLGQPEVVLRAAGGAPGVPDTLRLGDIVLPVTPQGEVWLHYRPLAADTPVSARAVLAQGDDPDLRARLEGRIVLVGAPPSGPADLYRTALGETVPRTMIHAALIEQALARTSLRRDLSSDWAEVAALALTGLIVMAAMALGGPGWALTAAIIAGGTVAAASWFAFTEGALLVDATYPLAGTAILLLLLTVWWRTVAQRPARAIGQSLGHSVSAETLARVVARGPQADLDGSTRPVSVLVCDIRNFGAMTQGMTGPAVVEMMNRIFGTLGDEILAEGGTLDKVVGDALLAFWNAPLDQPDHPVMAARAALRLRGALARYNARTVGVGQAGGLPSVALTMGVASGMGWVGRIGPHGRLAYSVLGDTVSQAARVETACRHVGYDILLGGEAARRARDLAVLDAGSLQLRGGRVDTAILVGAEPLAASTAFRDLEACHLTLLRAIRDDDAARMAARLAECRGLAASVEPGLAAFYDRIDRRTQDYR